MAITGPASYLPTTEAFLDHWLAVNDALDPATLTVPGEPLETAPPITLAALQTLFDELEASHATVQGHVLSDDLARDDVSTAKQALLVRHNQFNEKVRGLLPGTKWERVLPLVPSIGDVRSKFLDPMVQAAGLWLKIHTAGVLQPAGTLLVLLNGYTQAMFAADIEALRLKAKTAGQAELALRLAREERNDLQEEIHPILKQYRVLMPTFVAEGHALAVTLPLLTPLPGHTPEPVAAAGSWDAAAGAGIVTWPASTEADLDHYEVR